jgi:hypothetical protein
VRGDGTGLTPASFRFQREKGETVEVMMLTGGAQCQRAGEGTEGTGSEKGRWAAGSIPIWAELFPPGPVSYFSRLCFFSIFLFYLFLSYILQKCSKSLQTTFRDFAKFTARF